MKVQFQIKPFESVTEEEGLGKQGKGVKRAIGSCMVHCMVETNKHTVSTCLGRPRAVQSYTPLSASAALLLL